MAELAKNLNFDTRGQKGSPSLELYGLTIILLCCIFLCLLRYVKNVFLCFLRLCVLSIFPVSTTFSRSYLRIICPRNVICLQIMSCVSPFPIPALRNTSHVLTLSDQGILNIQLRNQCPAASKFSFIPMLNVHVSHPQSRVDQIQHFSTLSRTGILMYVLPHTTFFIDVNAALAIPIRLLTSFSSEVNTLPSYTKVFTYSMGLP